MPAPTNTLLIEGSFTELCEELAQYLDVLRTNTEGSASVSTEIAPQLETLRQQEQQTDEKANLALRDEVLKKIVAAGAILNGAPEKGIPFAFLFLYSFVSNSGLPRIHPCL
jgi:translation initiation factor 3 subunit M